MDPLTFKIVCALAVVAWGHLTYRLNKIESKLEITRDNEVVLKVQTAKIEKDLDRIHDNRLKIEAAWRAIDELRGAKK